MCQIFIEITLYLHMVCVYSTLYTMQLVQISDIGRSFTFGPSLYYTNSQSKTLICNYFRFKRTQQLLIHCLNIRIVYFSVCTLHLQRMEKNKTLVHTNLYDIVHGDSSRIFINNAVIVFKHAITLTLTGFIKDTNMH